MNRRTVQLAPIHIAVLLVASAGICDEPPPKKSTAPAANAACGLVTGRISADQERYVCRQGAEHFLPKATGFEWKMMPLERVPSYESFLVSFPSPLPSEFPENNTVYAEYYRPVGKTGVPGVVVLHILGGDFEISRLLSRHLASQGIGALFVQMAYYGHRRPKGRRRGKLLTENLDRTVTAVRQTVMDVRRAALWLSRRPEVNGRKIGIAGTSLGAFISCLAAGAEPRFRRYAFVLGGGNIATVIWNGAETAKYKKKLVNEGYTYESFAERLRQMEPLNHVTGIDRDGALMVNAKHDRVVPPSCTTALWEKLGRPTIFWYDCNHYTMLAHIFDVLAKVSRHFGEERWGDGKEKANG